MFILEDFCLFNCLYVLYLWVVVLLFFTSVYFYCCAGLKIKIIIFLINCFVLLNKS